MSPLEISYFLFLLIMLAQAWLNLRLNLFAWESPERQESIRTPGRFYAPAYSFTAVVPALNEAEVIGQTILKLARTSYPKHMVQILVLCRNGDEETIHAARKTIIDNRIDNAVVVIYYGDVPGKPVQLNQGLQYAEKDVFVIFDAEDDMHKDIFGVANAILLDNPNASVLQSGVQLMDYDSRWYSVHNVLEYFFWYKSRMHYHARLGVVPLGGNTVFFKTGLLRQAGGWREDCLTEDADIGIRLSAGGSQIVTTYDAQYVTRESVPPTVGGFVKQRTRWTQGFIQVLRYRDWQNYPLFSQRLWALYIMGFSIFQALLIILSPVFLGIGLFASLPVWLTLFSFAPLFLTLTLIMVQLVGLNEFLREQKLPHKLSVYALLPLTFIPYQILLNVAIIRAFIRELRSQTDWEKTAHLNIHRAALEPAMSPVGVRND